MIDRPKHKLVYLEWSDAVSPGAGWRTEEWVKRWARESGFLICEVGFVLEETDEYVLFASRICPEDAYTDALYGGIHKIPKTWIRKRRVIRGVYP
jgi:hypothetical protein